MHPILFEIRGWPIYTYGVLLAAAYLAALQLAVVRARKMGLDGARVMDLGIYLIIAALVGAKLMLIAVDFNYFRTQPREMLSLVRAGGVFYGGLIAALSAKLLGLPVENWPVLGGLGNASWVQLSGYSGDDATVEKIRWRLDVWNASAQVAGDVL